MQRVNVIHLIYLIRFMGRPYHITSGETGGGGGWGAGAILKKKCTYPVHTYA